MPTRHAVVCVGNKVLLAICSYDLNLHLGLKDPFLNTALPTLMQATVIRDKDRFFNPNDFVVLSTHDFKPFFRRGPELVWKPTKGSERTLTNEELLTDVLDIFRSEFSQATQTSS